MRGGKLEMRILLDLDDVLVDFMGAAAAKWGLTLQDVERHWQPDDWCMSASISRIKGPHLEPITLEEFWEPMNSEEFWINLKPLPWAETLLATTRRLTNDWHIVTAPSPCEGASIHSYAGKVKWLKNYFGKGFARFIITPHKETLAQPGVVLIDDREANIASFIMNNGVGILFPKYYNSSKKLAEAEDPVQFVLGRLEQEAFLITKYGG